MDKLYTIGVYGTTEDSFFSALQEHNIDLFCDIRLRRGVRGSKYLYANSTRLQVLLTEYSIDYLHYKSLAPTKAILDSETVSDKQKKVARRKRTILSDSFTAAYQKVILSSFDLEDFLEKVGNYKRVCLFCVECLPDACHRSLVANYLQEKLDIPLEHLTPCQI